MRNKKIKLIQILSCGAMGAGAVSTGTVLIMNSIHAAPQSLTVDERIDLSTKSCTLTSPFLGSPSNETLLTAFTSQKGLSNFNDLHIADINPNNKSFTVVTDLYSQYYIENTEASCYWTSTIVDGDWTALTGTIIASNLQVFEDTNVSRNEMLSDLATQYPDLDVNQLYIDMSGFNQDNKSAIVKTAPNASMYANKTATLIAGFTTATDLSFTNATIGQTPNSSVATFKFKGSVVTPTYTVSPAPASPVTWANQTLTLTTGQPFPGCMYTITASYVNNGNTYVTRGSVYDQPSFPDRTYDLGKVSSLIPNDLNDLINQKFGSAAAIVNGNVTFNTSSSSNPGIPVNGQYFQGMLSFMSGGDTFRITCQSIQTGKSFSGTGAKTLATTLTWVSSDKYIKSVGSLTGLDPQFKALGSYAAGTGTYIYLYSDNTYLIDFWIQNSTQLVSSITGLCWITVYGQTAAWTGIPIYDGSGSLLGNGGALQMDKHFVINQTGFLFSANAWYHIKYSNA